MSKVFEFGGYSDDTFGEITPRGDDYDNCANGEVFEWWHEAKYGARPTMLTDGRYIEQDKYEMFISIYNFGFRDGRERYAMDGALLNQVISEMEYVASNAEYKDLAHERLARLRAYREKVGR